MQEWNSNINLDDIPLKYKTFHTKCGRLVNIIMLSLDRLF